MQRPLRSPPTPLARRLAWPLLGVLMLAGLTGCQDEEIRRYKVARTPTEPPRLLGAIIPAGDKIWFVKLMGPAPAVAEQQAAFEQFVRSLRFKDGATPPVTWTLPADWQEQPGDQMSFAAFRAGKDKLKLTLTPLGHEAASVLDNVNRWRGQVGLKPTTKPELAAITRSLDVDGHTATLVDLSGPGADANPKSAIGAPAPAGLPKPETPAGRKPLTYDVPAGWEEIPASGFRVAAFRVRDGERSAEVTIIPLAGQAGGRLANVNRWRKEVGLDDITEAQLLKEMKPIQVDNVDGFTVDLLGPESAGAKRERTLGAILPRGEQSWFVKLRGPAELVGKQQAAFEAFVRSLRFSAGGQP